MGRSVEREEMGQRGKGYETLFTMIRSLGSWRIKRQGLEELQAPDTTTWKIPEKSP